MLTNDDLGSDWLGDSPGDGSIGDPTAFLRSLQREYGGCSTSSAAPKPAATFAGDYFGLEYGNTASLAQSEVGSVARFYASVAAAKKAFSEAINPGVVACSNRILKAAIQSVFRALGLSSASVPVAAFRIVPVSSGAQQTGALEFAGKISYAGEHQSVYLKLILLRQGRAATIIYLEDFGTPFPAGLERTLINKVAAKLRADGGR